MSRADAPWYRSPTILGKDVGGLLLYYPGAYLLSRMPRSALRSASTVGGEVMLKLQGADRSELRDELDKLFGPSGTPTPEQEILRRAFHSGMFNELEILRYPYLDEQTIDDVCIVEGREHLDAALERGKGAIVLIGHFGANQMIMPALGYKGYKMNQLSAPPPVWGDILLESRTTQLWNRILERRWELEQRLPVQHINVFKFLRPAYECLERNEVLGLAFDGGGGQRWTQIKLLNRTANISVQPAQLWRRTDAALLPTVVIREPGQKRHRIIIEAPLEWQPRKKREEAWQINLQAFADRFAPWVAKYPDHYIHFMLGRRRVRGTDVMPFFDDYPALEGVAQMDAEEASKHLRAAGAQYRGEDTSVDDT